MVKNLGKYPLSEEQNNYATKIVNAYIFYDLDGWPRNSSYKIYVFRATDIVKNGDKENWVQWSWNSI